MASSSSSSRPSKPYEVFISFRGDVTRNNFVSHLHHALKDRGIRTYFEEDNLQKGQTISSELVKAIQDSKIAIVVLSTNYASSTWCLDELAKIIDCKHLRVFPIFYHVDPSDIRKKKNSFGEALSKHEKNLKDGGQKVKIWRDALTQVANLAGVHITGEENEAKCIEEIADQIFRQLAVNAFPSTKFLVGIESRISKIKELMSSKFNEVVFIGLWGMGGIGKTATAKVLLEDCKKEFDDSCFLPDVRQKGIVNSQNILLSKVLKTSVDISNVDQGSSMIKDTLSWKKILLVIDDVDDIDQVNALAKEPNWFGGGSRIIITTRDEGLLNDDHIVKYNVETLSKEEAFHLFCLHVFKNNQPPEDYKDLSDEVVSLACGLPLALEVLGNYLKGKDKSFWNETLKRLREPPQGSIMSSLRYSYDGLTENQKDIFLNIACFFRGYRYLRVKKRLESLGLFLEEGVDVLVQKSLIHITKDDCIEMHDLLQEMGQNIVRQEANHDVRSYNRLWLKNDIVDVLSGIKGPSQAECIFLGDADEDLDYNFYGDASDYSSVDDDNDVFDLKLIWEGGLTNMNKLRFLELSEEILKENHTVSVVTQPSADVELCPSLRWFSWSKYPGQSLPKSFHPWHLVHLRMIYSNIKETPDVSHMPNLEVLNLRGSKKLVEVHPSLGDHRKIKLIDFSYCIKIKMFPKINQMESLEVLDLCYTKLRSFPEIHGNLNSLTKLGILRLEYYHGDLGISPPIQVGLLEISFPRLVNLEITYTDIVQTPDFRLLPCLGMLDLSGSRQLAKVHESLGNHIRIRSIKLENCSNLKEFPSIGDMDSLEELILSQTGLQSFPEITGNVNHLVELDLEETKITTLPRSIERATSLETISLRGCKHLDTLDLPLSSSLVIHFSRYSIYGDLIVSQAKGKFSEGKGKFSGPQIYFRVDKRLEELPEILLFRVVFIHIQHIEGHKSALLTRWICSNLVDLLHKYQHLCKLQLHGEHRSALSDYFSPTFSDVDSMSNMLRKRDNYFEVEVYDPRGRIPSAFQYRICGSCVNVFIKSIDKLKGFCICGLDAKLTNKYVPLASRSSTSFGDCDCDNKMDSNIVVMYIPIDIIKGDRSDWDGEKECTLFELTSYLHLIPESRRADPIWGLSLVYNEGEGEVDPPIIMTANDRLDSDDHCTMKVMIAESIGIQQPLLEQQLIGVKDEDGSMVYRARLGVAESSRDNQDDLDSLYCPPFSLMNHGSFEEAKDNAKIQNKWLLLNLQSTKEISSHMLNRETWANEVVAQIIKSNFIFWQVNDDTEEGRELCTDYRINAAPVILMIDPLTSEERNSWHGRVQPESLLEDLMPYLDRSPADHPIIPAHKRRRDTEDTQAPPQPWNNESNYDDKELQQPIDASMAGMNEENVPSEKEMEETVPDEEDMAMSKPNYPPLPEEPMSDINLLCRILFRLPDGRRLQRNYLRTDPIQLLWSFCYTQLEEAKTRPFRLAQTIPGSKPLDYHSSVTLGDSGLANSMISVTWNNERNYDDKELQQPIDASMAGMNEENIPSEKEMEETVPDEEDMAMSKPNYPTLPGAEYEDGSMVYGGPAIKGIQQSLLGQQPNHVEDEDEAIQKLEVTPEFTNVQFRELQKFCSLFTSSYEFDKDTMIQMWVAEGLFEPETIAPMEIMADDVFDYLVQEKVIQSIRYEGFVYKMYDTHKIQDLISARSAANDKFVVKEPGGTSKVSESAPANESELSKLSVLTETLLLISAYFNPLPFDKLCKFKNLCTLILVCEKGYSVKHVPREVFLVLKKLRLLDMHGSGISELPSSIGNLKCLRYLDMSETPIVSLPETVDCLSELQTLKLRNCVGISRLPKDMNKLTNLRHLDLDIIGRLNLMPIGIGCLSKLQTLSAFLIDKAEGYRIGELKALNNLKGSLCLKRLDNISSPDEAAEANLIGKKYLSKLELQWEIYPIGRSEIQEKILDHLQPNSNLKELDILYYSGSTFPNWLGDPLCVNIVSLDLFKCENAQHLPSLGGLLSLRSLSLTEMNSVKNINHLFRSTKESRVIHAFPRLEKLTIDIMLNLERWIDIEKGDFPSIVHFSVKCCPKLSELPFLSYVNTLKYLNISECEALQALPRDRLSASLETLIITDCPKLKNRCCSPTGDDWSKIAHVPSIYIDYEPVSHTTRYIPE